ncbi:retinoblastoma-like protein 1 isoform X3 [Bombus vosnesenskii]|uniref:Retinoblastoma-like protein 1 isoform X3 n=3 Tax=Pyrobombus TaxID=144703 RepID=A0A6J3LJK4_9HYME|nr:retinoblastoma-like protein 1 isoform X3 [Bombus impatiens]XP_033192822.1 retinoblastoma-like protein 1 isoform X3 [Bombus vancouverensis nearcticus]XP_033303491.1 retinoblastoma-like protein 1 isoform X3 [Bombus bifarius]XP_033364049.1 retinoblastoma-like protein 1 isoform X3 [Bombus vosnesenskii]XP_050484907.1 retinoblastoma-like protein 1 isoform X3 [Bombus huntii]
MGQSDDVEDSTYSRHQDLCQKLNMDATAASEAWKSYETIRQNYTLEGDQLHWIGCALYVACRKSSIPTVGKTGTNVEGNCVSLTRLLQLCNLPLIQFFTKSKSWADMANMSQDFRSKIEKLEGNFAVSMVIFKKYQPIFTDIFKDPVDDISRPPRSRRHKAMPCTPARVFEFCWTLFICIKGAFPDISDDLVNSYHLLLVCCDLIYSNALLANRKDLLNPNFPGLPSNFNDENYIPPQTANCIVSLLCERHEAIAVEAKVIKEYYLKNHINKLFNERVLRGDQTNFSGILEALYFDGNSKAINRVYEQHVLSVGDFDERIFLGHDASNNIGSPTQMMNVGDLHEQFQMKKEQYSGQIQHLAPPTPLTGRSYLRPKDITNVTPVSTATQSVIRLQAMLAGQTSPSENLLQILNSCSQDVKTLVETKVKELGELFCANYNKSTNANDTTSDFGKMRLYLGQTLFYRLLEMILNDEKRKKPNYDVTNLLTKEIFIQCLFACCLEIVIYSYKSNDKIFPWILNALSLDAYYFYKVIEIIVRAENQLSRDVVKHLNQIEEKILESLAWQSDSPLWSAIQSTPEGVPSCEEVSLPGMLETVDPNIPGQPVLRRIALDRGTHHDVQQSPISSASERFQSPVAASGVAKKRLFPDTRIGGQSVLRVTGQSVLPSKVLTIDGNSRILLLPEQITVPRSSSVQSTGTPMQTVAVNREPAKPKRTGSVALFFRKFYNLASVRMLDLCGSLEIMDIDLKKKIWTIFEYSIKERTELMKDRHLDQILMCAIYVICKLAKMEKNSFTEIMRCYRLQPQAESHIYRSVLIAKTPSGELQKNNEEIGQKDVSDKETNAAPPTPTNMAGTSQNFGEETRGDLIKFYNTVYVPQVKEVANKLGLARGSVMNLSLSPLPKGKPPASSPVRRVTSSIMTRTLDPKAISASPAPQLSYCFSRSPAKDLEAINKMMISVDPKRSVGKRLLTDETDVEMSDGGPSPIKKTTTFVARKLENIIGERRTQNQ